MSPRKRRLALFSASHVVRRAVRRALEGVADLEIAIEDAQGAHAPDLVEAARPDLVVIDTYLPDVDGFELTRAIMARCPTPIVLLTDDAMDQRQVRRAWTAGAVHLTSPPPPPQPSGSDRDTRGFVELLRNLSGSGAQRPAALPRPSEPQNGRPVSVVGIVSSAGGPQVLEVLLSGAPAGVLPPILLVQHLATGFTKGFADWLAGSSGYPVRIAEHGQHALPGTLYLAPEHTQFWMDREGVLTVDRTDDGEMFRPSGDLLLEHLAREHGPAAVAIVLSGMGDDGAQGAVALHRAGGRVLVQADAPIDSMPGAAVARGAADAVLPAAAIAAWLRDQRATP